MLPMPAGPETCLTATVLLGLWGQAPVRRPIHAAVPCPAKDGCGTAACIGRSVMVRRIPVCRGEVVFLEKMMRKTEKRCREARQGSRRAAAIRPAYGRL